MVLTARPEKRMRRVLVVDDDKAVRSCLYEVLNAQGYKAAEAETAPLALATQMIFRPHIVLLDVVMPGMTGNEIIKKLVAFDSNVVVIIMTGFPNEGLASLAIEMGARDYIVKPFDLAQLKTMLQVYELTELLE